MRSKLREKRRAEWKTEAEEAYEEEYKSKKPEPEPDVQEPTEEEKQKDSKDVSKRDETTFKDSVNEDSLATSNAFPATSTQDNMSMMNQGRDQAFTGGYNQMQGYNQNLAGSQNMGNMNMNMNMQGPTNQMNAMNAPRNISPAQNMGQQQNMTQAQSMANLGGSRLPSLSSLHINPMNNQQNNMMNQSMRLQSMFGGRMPNQPMGMNQMGMRFNGQTANTFQGGRMVAPGYNPGMNMYGGNNMQMMGNYPGMQNQMYGNMNQMQRPGMMPFNQNMPLNSGMMNNGMNYQFQNQMMRGMNFNNPQYAMLPPGQQMQMNNGHLNQNMNRTPKTIDALIQGDQYVPGTLEDHVINAINNTDYR